MQVSNNHVKMWALHTCQYRCAGFRRQCLQIRGNLCVLFTSDFAVKTGQSDGKGLHSAQRVVVVQRENVVSYSAKLHHNVVHWKKKDKSNYEHLAP